MGFPLLSLLFTGAAGGSGYYMFQGELKDAWNNNAYKKNENGEYVLDENGEKQLNLSSAWNGVMGVGGAILGGIGKALSGYGGFLNGTKVALTGRDKDGNEKNRVDFLKETAAGMVGKKGDELSVAAPLVTSAGLGAGAFAIDKIFGTNFNSLTLAILGTAAPLIVANWGMIVDKLNLDDIASGVQAKSGNGGEIGFVYDEPSYEL